MLSEMPMNYVKNILENSLENRDPKPFWKYIKQQRQDSIGVAPLKSDGKPYSESKDKTEILNKQLESVFTKNENIPTLKLYGTKHTDISKLKIMEPGVKKLLGQLNVRIPNLILKELSTELAPLITAIFNQSLETGKLPKERTNANVTPVPKRK